MVRHLSCVAIALATSFNFAKLGTQKYSSQYRWPLYDWAVFLLVDRKRSSAPLDKRMVLPVSSTPKYCSAMLTI